MEDSANHNAGLMRRIVQLETEKDELQRDIETLCMQQSGFSGSIDIVSRMQARKAAGFEQELEACKQKLTLHTKDNLNLQQELAEAHLAKGRVADAFKAAMDKNKELEKEVKFYQSRMAGAFTERDKALVEVERLHTTEKIMINDVNELHNRLEQTKAQCSEQEKTFTDLQYRLETHVLELEKSQKRSFLLSQVVEKFWQLRGSGKENGDLYDAFVDKAQVLLEDKDVNWVYGLVSRPGVEDICMTAEHDLALVKEELVLSKAASATLEETLVLMKDASAKLEEELLFTKAASTKLDEELAFTKAASTKLEEELVLTKAASTKLEEELLFTKAASARLDEELVLTKAASTKLEEELLFTKAVSTKLEEELVHTKAASTKCEEELVCRKVASTQLEKELVLTKAAATKLEEELVLTKAAATKLEEELVLTKVAATKLEEELVLTKAASTQLEKELVLTKAASTDLKLQLEKDALVQKDAEENISAVSAQLALKMDIIHRELQQLKVQHIALKTYVSDYLEDEKRQVSLLWESLQHLLERVNSEPLQQERRIDVQEKDEAMVVEAPRERKGLRVHFEDEGTSQAMSSSKEEKEIGCHNTLASFKDDSKQVLAQALQEKVEALLLLSQQEERYYLEALTHSALETQVAKLNQKLIQVTGEKVKALLELAEERSRVKQLQEHERELTQWLGQQKGTSINQAPDQLGVRTKQQFPASGGYLKSWLRGLDISAFKPTFSNNASRNNGASDVIPSSKSDGSIGVASLLVENAALQERIASMQHLAKSVHHLRMILLKVATESHGALTPPLIESAIEDVDSVKSKAEQLKVGFGCSLPVSFQDSLFMSPDNLCVVNSSEEILDENEGQLQISSHHDSLSLVGMEMAELLLATAELQTESLLSQLKISSTA